MKNNIYSQKGAFELKDMDTQKREVSLYLSKFDAMDSDFDIIRKGSFSKSLKERGPGSTSNRKIAFLRHHDWEKQIGKFLKLEEDDNGLFAVAQLGRSTDGEDAYRDYEDGIIKEHSIGFQYIKDKIDYIEKLTKELNVCIKALSNGKGTDERLHSIEMKVKQVTSQLILLAGQESEIIHSIPDEPVIVDQFKWNDVLSSLEGKLNQ